MKQEKELRTLKDIDEDRKKYLWSPSKTLYKLRQEAIKHIKDIDINLKEFEQYQGQIIKSSIADKVQGLIATREWIKHFFNITEEELK